MLGVIDGTGNKGVEDVMVNVTSLADIPLGYIELPSPETS